MEVKKISISADKEYDALRQEILKRVEMQNNHLNLILTILTVLFSIGVSNTKISFLIPPILCLLTFIWKSNNSMILRLSTYISKKYEGENSDLSWESYNKETIKFSKPQIHLLSIGPFGIFIFTCIIAVLLGLSNYNHTKLELLLLIIAILSLIIVIALFFFYSSEKLSILNEK